MRGFEESTGDISALSEQETAANTAAVAIAANNDVFFMASRSFEVVRNILRNCKTLGLGIGSAGTETGFYRCLYRIHDRTSVLFTHKRKFQIRIHSQLWRYVFMWFS